MQIGLTLFAWVAVRSLGTWPRAFLWAKWLVLQIRYLVLKPSGRSAPSERLDPFRNHGKAPIEQQYTIIKSSLVDFQEAQCFFIIATQAAILTAIKTKGVFFGSATPLEATTNYVFAAVLGLGGLLPTTFTIFILCTIGMVSWYTLGLASISVATSLATVQVIGLSGYGNFAASVAEDIYYMTFSQVSDFEECGNQIPPGLYLCEGSYPQLRSPSIASIKIFCLLVFASILLYRVSAFVISQLLPTRYRTILRSWFQQSRDTAMRLCNPRFVQLPLYVLFLTIDVVYIYYIIVYALDLGAFRSFGAIDLTSWSMGQIIAVVV